MKRLLVIFCVLAAMLGNPAVKGGPLDKTEQVPDGSLTDQNNAIQPSYTKQDTIAKMQAYIDKQKELIAALQKDNDRLTQENADLTAKLAKATGLGK